MSATGTTHWSARMEELQAELDDVRARWKAANLMAEDYESALIEIADFGAIVSSDGIAARKVLARHGVTFQSTRPRP